MVEIFCFESILFDYFIWATLYYTTENRNWLAKVFDVDATKFLCIFPFLDMSKQRDEEGKKKENIQFSVYISTLKHTFDRFTVLMGILIYLYLLLY